jgi:DNA-binding NtrC family response regulator
MDKNNLQIVVVDDEAQITDLLMTYLLCLSKSFSVTTFNDPEEARAYLLQNHIDVLITDFKMPKYDGIQLMRLVPKDATKILISGYVSEITEGHLNELKASFFEKPVPMKELGKLIHAAEAKKKKPA